MGVLVRGERGEGSPVWGKLSGPIIMKPFFLFVHEKIFAHATYVVMISVMIPPVGQVGSGQRGPQSRGRNLTRILRTLLHLK